MSKFLRVLIVVLSICLMTHLCSMTLADGGHNQADTIASHNAAISAANAAYTMSLEAVQAVADYADIADYYFAQFPEDECEACEEIFEEADSSIDAANLAYDAANVEYAAGSSDMTQADIYQALQYWDLATHRGDDALVHFTSAGELFQNALNEVLDAQDILIDAMNENHDHPSE